jgi:DNA-binding PadR family transcriptional regulator
MLQSGLIEEVAGDNPRRKYYRLTEEGRASLSAELQRYNDAVGLARRKKLFKDLGLSKAGR